MLDAYKTFGDTELDQDKRIASKMLLERDSIGH